MAVTAAAAAVETSRAAIAAQAAKTYTIAITSETGLKQDVGVVRQQLNNDLRTTQNTVQAVREMARKAATTLAQLPKPSPSVSVSPVSTSSAPVVEESVNQ
ncbi:MAG: hypothetical protein A3I92_02085 [Candidatus Yanofskybacteria bacterium RIFCSPLOWO2_02_FULL_43_10b]|uniref:Uncharacterized protein n=1 Tax=Candidatus Yanofskybacteria bacterium RIFCSPLOWO2_02_FULL_43_10b TaxID=1802704 RepID=A0A1F8GYP0_9BACT|nr:MAG: hypothetical protein A3I92_02085 [Candidatus Yanofskybacteria bacterium RIFCSPLOWO2_02_FULL_43_10b]